MIRRCHPPHARRSLLESAGKVKDIGEVVCHNESSSFASGQSFMNQHTCYSDTVGGPAPETLCQKRGVAYPRSPYLRRGETMLFDVPVQLVIRPEVTTNG